MQFITRILALLLLLSAGNLNAQPDSDQYEQAANAYQSGDFLIAEQLWMELANQGDPNSQYALGIMHLKQEAQRPDDAAAFRYLVEAAKKQHVASMFNLGVAYWEGRGVMRQPEKALNWWEVAAQRDDASAQYNLGLAYYIGEGRDQSTPKAIYWVKQAAENGHPQARSLLTTLQQKSREEQLAEETGQIASARQSTPATSSSQSEVNASSQKPAAGNGSRIHLSSRETSLHAAANENSAKVLTLEEGTSVRALRRSGDWTQVLVARSYPVWVYETFIVELGNGKGKIKGNKVNIRPSASTNNETSPPLGQLNDGDRIAIVSKNRPWVKVMPPKPFPAWVKTQDLK